MPSLLLASSSPYRQALLKKLQLPFISASPEIDESALPGEHITARVERLAQEKAAALASQYPDHWIIGSDQLCSFQGEQLGKAGTTEAALAQLIRFRGQAVTFYTGLCLRTPSHNFSCVEPFTVHFRDFTPVEAQSYIALEQPLDCAGSFKSEGLGITLFERLEGDDPNSLIGLPLIRLCRFLDSAGCTPLLAVRSPATC